MKLSEIKGERAIEVFADLLEPVGKILSDKEIVEAIQNNESRMLIIQKLLKMHSREVIEMLAIVDGVPVDEYEVNFVTLPAKLIEMFNDEAITELFS